MSASTATSFASTLVEQTRFVLKVVESILSVEPRSLVATDLSYASVAKIAKRYVVLHKDAVHSFLTVSGEDHSSRGTSLPSQTGYYLSTILCGTRIIISGFPSSSCSEVQTISSHVQQLGAELWNIRSIEDILTYLHSNKSLHIVVPSCSRALQFLGALLAHKNHIKNERIKSVVSDTDIQQIAKTFITKDLVYQLMHNKASPQIQLRLLSSECFIPILYGMPIRYIGYDSSSFISTLLLAGAIVVRSGDPRTVSFYETREFNKVSAIFSPYSTKTAYLPSSSTFYCIPRIYGHYKSNLTTHFLKHVLFPVTSEASIMDQYKTIASTSISAVNNCDHALSILSGVDDSAESCPSGKDHILHACGYEQIVTYSEQIVNGLIVMSMGYQLASIQTKTKSIFKSQHSIARDNYLSIRYTQGRYSELIILLRARPLVCSFYIPRGFTPMSNALITSLNKAVVEYTQLIICEKSIQWYHIRQSSLFTLLQTGLQFPSANIAAHILTDKKDNHEPSLKRSHGNVDVDVDIDTLWCRLQANDNLLKDLMSVLIYSSMSFIPFSMLPNLYSFIKERLFLIVDPSLLLLMSAYVTRSASYSDITKSIVHAIPQILGNMRQYYTAIFSDTFSFKAESPLIYTTNLSKDLEACALNGKPCYRSYSCLDSIVIKTPLDSEYETTSLIPHFRSMIWLQLIIELLYADYINVLLSNKENIPAETPFCLFSDLTQPCSVCGSNPASPDASTLLSSLCNSIHTIIEFTGLDLAKTAHLGSQSPPGYLHWSMFASMDTKTIMDVGETIIEGACKRVEGKHKLCKTCRQLNVVFQLPLSGNNFSSYRHALYNRITRVIINSLLLVWRDGNKLETIAKQAGIEPKTVSSLDFICSLSNRNYQNDTLNGVHFSTFLVTLFKERGNYGVAEAKGRREYSLICQNAMMMHQPITKESYIAATNLFNDLESTAIVSHSSTIMEVEKSNQQIYNLTVPEDSYDDPRFQRRANT